jgi:hypothetical protein
MNLSTEPYLAQSETWPNNGRQIMAQFDAESVIVSPGSSPGSDLIPSFCVPGARSNSKFLRAAGLCYRAGQCRAACVIDQFVERGAVSALATPYRPSAGAPGGQTWAHHRPDMTFYRADDSALLSSYSQDGSPIRPIRPAIAAALFSGRTGGGSDGARRCCQLLCTNYTSAGSTRAGSALTRGCRAALRMAAPTTLSRSPAMRSTKCSSSAGARRIACLSESSARSAWGTIRCLPRPRRSHRAGGGR